MGPTRKSRNVKKRFSYVNEISPTKDGDYTNKKSQRKRKLSDMLGPHWNKEELENFYKAYRKHGKDWRKVAAVLRNRSVEMAEAVYSLNRAYLSLPEGTASVAGFIAMMTDYYSNMEEGDNEQESDDDMGTSRKPQKSMPGKVHETTSKNFLSLQGAVASDYGCMSVLKKKRSGGSRPRAVGKRTPRFPVSFSCEDIKGEKYFSPSRKGLKLKADNDDEVAQVIAKALAEASQRSDSLVSSPGRSAKIMGNKHLDEMLEACSGTEGQNLTNLQRESDAEVADAKPSRYSSQHSTKRSKEALFENDESSAIDALQTLANLSLMISPPSNENDSFIQVKEENKELVDDSRPLQAIASSRRREKRKSSVLVGKGNQSNSRLGVADYKALKSAKSSDDNTNAASEVKESHQSITKVSRKRQKIVAPKDGYTGQISVSKSKRPLENSSPQLVRHAEHVPSSIHSKMEVSSSTLSAADISKVNHTHAPTKVKSRRKTHKPQILEFSKFSNVVKADKSNIHFPSPNDKTVHLKEHLKICLSNKLMRRWCAFEWFYSAIDYPWFAKREFVEYLNHVGLGHVPRLTRVEWGVIRSSLGKPRRFSDQFLKEEKDKLNQYRGSVRTHYSELRSGTTDGLPTDLARPLLVGQRIIAIYPGTREIHDGKVLTVHHNRCRVQFDQRDLGVQTIMDIDCMPLNQIGNMPTSLMSRMVSVDKFFESLNELKMNGLGKDERLERYTKSSCGEKQENMDEVVPIKSRSGPMDIASIQHSAYSTPATLLQMQAKETDVQALAELTRALDKKEAVVFELRQMNDDMLENLKEKEGDSSLKDSDPFKKQYAAVLVQLNEANAQVSSALYQLRQRNTYQRNIHLTCPRPVSDLSGISSSSIEDSECQVNEIVEISKTKARTMVDIAIQAMSSFKVNHTVENEIDKTVDYVIDRLPLENSHFAPNPMSKNFSIINKTPIPAELITHCVATSFIIQKCTERQFPPSEVARILDFAVSSLQPCCSQNLPVFAEIQKCMGIIKNQILALVPT